MVAHEHPLKFFLEALSAQKKKKKKNLVCLMEYWSGNRYVYAC